MAGLGRFSVGRACAGPDCTGCTNPCTIFAVASFTDLTGLTEIGTVTVAMGVAELESGEGLIVDATPTNYYDPVIFSVTASTEGSSGTIRLAVARADADNYLFGEYSFSGTAGTLRLGKRESGTETWLSDAVEVEDTADLGDLATLILCWVPGEVQEGGEFEATGIHPTLVVSANPGTDWINPNDSMVEDDTYAECDFSSGPGTGGVASIFWSGFPVALPPGSVIDEIGVGIRCRRKILTGFGPIDMTGLWITDSTGTLGNNLGGTQTVPSPISPGYIGAQANMAAWGSDATWEHLNTGQFVVAAEFTQGPSAGDFLEIDAVVLDIFFTTPDRQPGRLTLSRGNVTAMTVDCARNFSATAPGEGKQAMVLAGAGDWDLASLDYSYHHSDAKPSCPACECNVDAPPCEECCDEGFPPAGEYVIDFGAGGWTDNACSSCSGVAGEYVLTARGECFWYYEEPFECEPPPEGDCYPSKLFIRLYLFNTGDGCRWDLAIGTYGLCEPDEDQVGKYVQYGSELLSSGENCQSLPVTLTKLGGDTGGVLCGGALPDEITLEAP